MRAQNKMEDYISEYIGEEYSDYKNPNVWRMEIFLGRSLKKIAGNRYCVDHKVRIS